MDDNNIGEVLKMIDAIILHAIQTKPDLIVVAGDLTHSQNTKLDSRSSRSMIDVITQLSQIAPVIVIIGTPSHDGLCAEILNTIPYEGISGRTVVVSTRPDFYHIVDGEIFTRDQVLEMDNSETEFVVSTLPTPTKQFFPQVDCSIGESDKQISNAITQIFAGFAAMAVEYPNAPHIHVGHYQIRGSKISETQTLVGADIEITTAQLAFLNADVIALGHIHKAQEMIIQEFIEQSGKNAFYPGSVTHNTFGELDEKGFYMHEFIGDKLLPDFQRNSEFVVLPARELHIIRKNFLERPVDQAEIENGLKDDLEGSWLKIEINIWHDEVRQINQATLEDHFLNKGCDRVVIDLIRKPREAIRSERVLEAETLPEKIIEMGKIKDEEIPNTILLKATSLEIMNAEDLYKKINEENL